MVRRTKRTKRRIKRRTKRRTIRRKVRRTKRRTRKIGGTHHENRAWRIYKCKDPFTVDNTRLLGVNFHTARLGTEGQFNADLLCSLGVNIYVKEAGGGKPEEITINLPTPPEILDPDTIEVEIREYANMIELIDIDTGNMKGQGVINDSIVG